MASSSTKSAAEAKILGKREPGDNLWTEPILKKHKEKSEEEETVEELDEPTLYVGHLSDQTNISSDIINFFKSVGEVVRVQLIVNHRGLGLHAGYGFVEFTSANEAKTALEKKNGEYLHGNNIFLGEAKIAPDNPRPNYCLDHKVWYEDYLQRESLMIEEDETVEGLVEEVTTREKTLFVANLSYQTGIPSIIGFFKIAADVVGVRLIVDDEGEYVGCGFFEFASSNEANKALEMKSGTNLHGRRIFLDVVKIAPYPLRPMYNLAEKLWKKMRKEIQREKKKSWRRPNRSSDSVVQRLSSLTMSRSSLVF